MDNKGMSLIEMLVVTVIIGVLAAIAIPKYTKYKEITKLKTLERLYNEINQKFQACMVTDEADDNHEFDKCAGCAVKDSTGCTSYTAEELTNDLEIKLDILLENGVKGAKANGTNKKLCITVQHKDEQACMELEAFEGEIASVSQSACWKVADKKLQKPIEWCGSNSDCDTGSGYECKKITSAVECGSTAGECETVTLP